jgi:hypothetical protein
MAQDSCRRPFRGAFVREAYLMYFYIALFPQASDSNRDVLA